jgi:hypothetical protein
MLVATMILTIRLSLATMILIDHPSRSCPLRDSYRRGSAAETGSRRWRPSSAMRCIRVKPSVVGLVDTTALEKVTVMNKDEPDATPIFQ